MNFPISRYVKRAFLNESGESFGKEIDSSNIEFLWPNLHNPKFKSVLMNVSQNESPNNICPVILYSIENGASFMWMGDLEKDMQKEFYTTCEGTIPEVDILFAPHHGRDSGKVPQELLSELNPKIIVIGDAPSEHICYYDSEKTITQNTAGDIYFECLDHKVRIYTKNNISNVPKGLKKESNCDQQGWSYIGTLYL